VAVRQAQPAVHAVGDQVGARWVVVVEGGLAVDRPQHVARLLAGAPGGVDHQIPPTNPPGAKRRPGPNWSLIRRIRARPPTGPHMSRMSRTSSGAVSTTAYPPARTHAARSSSTSVMSRAE